MKLLVYVCAQIIFIAFLLTLCRADSGEKGPKRSRLLSNVGLIPFPRIGRAGGDVTWEIDPATYPRIGRSWLNEADAINKRSGPKAVSTGLWFGPRLGRIQKRGGSYTDDPWTYVLLGGPERKPRSGHITPFMRTGRSGYLYRFSESEAPTFNRQAKYIPRLGRESEENFDDYSDANPLQTTEHAV